MNQELMKRIQSQAGLEAEVVRLKCLLVDIRGILEGEIGVKSAANKSKSIANETDSDKLPTFMFVRREVKQQMAIT
ncbi:hypothetical protein Hanom_Chr09g00828281 [Helianthus anomalus]